MNAQNAISTNINDSVHNDLMKNLKSSGYVQRICRDFERGGHQLFAKEKRLSLISDYDFDSLDSISTQRSNKNKLSSSKKPTIVTTEVINQVKEKLKHLNLSSDHQTEPTTKSVFRVSSFVHDTGHNYETLQTITPSNRLLNLQRNCKNTNQDEWSSRRKSYGFEQVQKQKECLQTVSKDSSTDSGICHSSDLISTPKHEIESYFHKRSQRPFSTVTETKEINENVNKTISKSKKVDFYKSEVYFSSNSNIEMNPIKSHNDKTIKWSSVINVNEHSDNKELHQTKRCSWAMCNSTNPNDFGTMSNCSSLTWPKIRIESSGLCDEANIVKLPRVSLKSTGLIRNTLKMTQQNPSSIICHQLAALNLNHNSDDDALADLEVQNILKNCTGFDDHSIMPYSDSEVTVNKQDECNKNDNILNNLSKDADVIFQIANESKHKSEKILLTSDDNHKFCLSYDYKNSENVLKTDSHNIRKKLTINHKMRIRRQQIQNNRETLLSSSEDLTTNKELIPRVRKPLRKHKTKFVTTINNVIESSNFKANFMKPTISSRLHATILTDRQK